jgi:hypothetical protein
MRRVEHMAAFVTTVVLATILLVSTVTRHEQSLQGDASAGFNASSSSVSINTCDNAVYQNPIETRTTTTISLDAVNNRPPAKDAFYSAALAQLLSKASCEAQASKLKCPNQVDCSPLPPPIVSYKTAIPTNASCSFEKGPLYNKTTKKYDAVLRCILKDICNATLICKAKPDVVCCRDTQNASCVPAQACPAGREKVGTPTTPSACAASCTPIVVPKPVVCCTSPYGSFAQCKSVCDPGDIVGATMQQSQCALQCRPTPKSSSSATSTSRSSSRSSR